MLHQVYRTLRTGRERQWRNEPTQAAGTSITVAEIVRILYGRFRMTTYQPVDRMMRRDNNHHLLPPATREVLQIDQSLSHPFPFLQKSALKTGMMAHLGDPWLWER